MGIIYSLRKLGYRYTEKALIYNQFILNLGLLLVAC